MTPEFHRWYELNVRRMDGTPKQAAWLAWQHRGDSRPIEEPAPRCPIPTGDESGCCCICGTATGVDRLCPFCQQDGRFSYRLFAAMNRDRRRPALVSQWPPAGQPRPVMALHPEDNLWGNLSDLMTP